LTSDEARALALALQDAVEQDHHGRRSFRVGGKIFGTLWDDEHMNVMLDEGGIRMAVEQHPDTCTEVHWGKRLAAVRVELPRAEAAWLGQMLTEAWELRAPGRLLRQEPKPIWTYGLPIRRAAAFSGRSVCDARRPSPWPP
jgi:hypothetical protein